MTANTKQPKNPSDELDYALSKWKRIPMTTKQSGKKSKGVKAWGIFTINNDLLYTYKEACIYYSYATALKEKGSHIIKSVLITPLPRTVKKDKK